MDFRVLGPLEIRIDDREVVIGARLQRVLLAVLLCHANRYVSTAALCTTLWPGRAPKSPGKALQVQVHRLRRSLREPDRIHHGPAGYRLAVHPGELDVDRFTGLVDRAGASSSATVVRDLLRSALQLWRGPALDDLDVAVVRQRVDEWREQRLAALEACADAELELGRHGEAVRELRLLVADNPLRERFRAQLMTALHRSGRRPEALEVFDAGRRLLADELGVDPGPELTRLHAAVLGPDHGTGPAAPLPPVPRQLPPDVPEFTGRGAALDSLDDLLGDRAAVVVRTVSGPPGVGKTALAVHWAHRVTSRFPGGQLYIDLRGDGAGPPVRPIEALTRFLRALGTAAQDLPEDVDEASALFRTLLSGRRVLVVLDNASSAAQVRPLLPGAPGCSVLVTSRDRLRGLVARDGARGLVLPVLSPGEAHLLLSRLLGPGVGAEPGAAAELARSCGHLPLALRVAAAALGERPTRTLAGYVRELASGARPGGLEVGGDEGAVSDTIHREIGHRPGEAGCLAVLDRLDEEAAAAEAPGAPDVEVPAPRRPHDPVPQERRPPGS